MSAPDFSAIGRRLMDQAAASADQMNRAVEQEMARMDQLTRGLLHLTTGSPLPQSQQPPDRADAIAAELNANPELKAKVMALVGVPVPPAPG